MSTVKQISSLAKKIRAKKPSMKWTDAIKAASKELKASGKIGAPKKRATTSTAKKATTTKKRTVKAPTKIKLELKNLDMSQERYKYNGRFYNVNDDQDGDFYIMVGGKAIYFKKPYPRMSGTKTRKTTPKQIVRKKVGSTHKDTKSHNVRINVLSGVKPANVVLNGVNRLVKNKYYVYNGKDIYPIVGLKGATMWKGSLLKYLGVKNNSLLFDIRFKLKSKTGYDTITERWELPRTMPASTFIPTKKPTKAELSIGHLKL